MLAEIITVLFSVMPAVVFVLQRARSFVFILQRARSVLSVQKIFRDLICHSCSRALQQHVCLKRIQFLD